MGTTIRREPITTSIPASPDYRFLNITNFGGIQKSSNPFVVNSNTASDCLNVYVDEDNALSTRPRVSPKYDLPTLANVGTNFETIGVYDLHDGYLLHGVEDDVYKMFKFVESETGLQTPIIISGTIPEKECKIFEQNDKIYLLTGEGYKNIIDAAISDVDAYVPTTRVGKNRRVETKQADGSLSVSYDLEGSSFESLNLLTDNYKESYFWDGTWDPYKIKDKDDESVENKYIKHTIIEFSSNGPDYDKIVLDYAKKASENSASSEYYLGYDYSKIFTDSEKRPFGVFEINKNSKTEVSFTPIPLSTEYENNYYNAKISSDGLSVYITNVEDVGITDNLPYLIWVFKRTSLTAPFTETGGIGSFNPYKKIVVGPSDKALVLTSENELYLLDNVATPVTTDAIIDFTVSPDFDLILAAIYDNLTDTITTLTRFRFNEDSYSFQKQDIQPFWDTENERLWRAHMKIGNDNQKAILTADIIRTDSFDTVKTGLYYYVDLRQGDDVVSVLNDTDYWSGGEFRFSENDEKVYFKTHEYSGWIFLKQPESIVKNAKDLDALDMPEVLTTNDSLVGINGFGIHEDSFLFNSSEPLLFVTRTLDEYSEERNNLEELREKLLSASLYQRFDNNTWFASDNTTFHTLYNDPTYIPLSGYNDLGEDYEEITGLSIVNDNILAAYKRNRIYIITPITVGDQLTYSYTETKNVIGNDVVGAPILTILTEMPIIVSYDGIYALNQLENVQSSDRITTLISENINPNWLKESKSDIDGCLTLNRLYWTYFILPHEKVDDERVDYSKVYLLDNRTQQWYYWELPLLCMNAFVKDNKTHLVDYSGKVYTLETSDLVNEYNPDVTEYYDKIGKNKKLIPWYWNSQILSLSTINYSKRLIDTTFILTDTDTQDEYALDYSFKAWRKSVSETNASTINSNIHYVQSTTKRTMIPRFNFIQIRLSNTEDDLDNNKLRLVGLGLKYVLLEGLY